MPTISSLNSWNIANGTITVLENQHMWGAYVDMYM